MKKLIGIFLLTLLIISSFTSVASATTLFLTSDNIVNKEKDLDMLESIAKYIEEISNGKISVVIDKNAPSPGEGSRAIASSEDVAVTLSAACAGNLLELGSYSVKSPKKIIFVNTGNLDLKNMENLRRSWDDNYSNEMFAGIKNPGKFLSQSGVKIIQATDKFKDSANSGNIPTDNDEINRYIAEEIVNYVNNPYLSNEHKLNKNLVVYHNLKPLIMAKSSAELLSDEKHNMDGKYNSYSASQLLYLSSSYLAGDSLKSPKEYKSPDNPLKYSFFTKNSYSIYEYMEMAHIVKEYMDKNKKAPDYINYKGGFIGYYDIVYNFAELTKNHVSKDTMDFERNHDFEKFNESILITILPITVIVLLVLLIIVFVKSKIKKRRY